MRIGEQIWLGNYSGKFFSYRVSDLIVGDSFSEYDHFETSSFCLPSRNRVFMTKLISGKMTFPIALEFPDSYQIPKLVDSENQVIQELDAESKQPHRPQLWDESNAPLPDITRGFEREILLQEGWERVYQENQPLETGFLYNPPETMETESVRTVLRACGGLSLFDLFWKPGDAVSPSRLWSDRRVYRATPAKWTAVRREETWHRIDKSPELLPLGEETERLIMGSDKVIIALR